MASVLAPTSQLIRLSPQPPHRESNPWERTARNELDDDLDLPQPVFSIAIDDEADGDDSFGEAPPRLSMQLEDGEQTGRSIEVARNVASENRKRRLSRGSFGSIGPSDRLSNVSASDLIDISRPLVNDSTVEHPLDVDADELGNLGLRLDAG